MEERKLNEKESLELISQMIRNTQQRFQRDHVAPLLVNGYVTTILAVIIWLLIKETQNGFWNLLWLTIPVFGFSGLKIFFKNRTKNVRTYIDQSLDYIWWVLGSIMVSAGLLTFFLHVFPILFLIILLIGIGITLTGLITKLKILTYAGILNILSSVLFLFPLVKGIDQILLFGAIFFVFMVVPGHILYSKKGTENV